MAATITVLANVDSDLLIRPEGLAIQAIDFAARDGAEFLEIVNADGAVFRAFGEIGYSGFPGQPPAGLFGPLARLAVESAGRVVVEAVFAPLADFSTLQTAGFWAGLRAAGLQVTDTRLAGDAGAVLGATLRGDAGNDTITSLGGADVILGGDGNDVIRFGAETAGTALTAAFRRGTVDGGGGEDRLEVLAGGAGSFVNLLMTPIRGVELLSLLPGASAHVSAEAFGAGGLSTNLDLALGAGAALRVYAGFDGQVNLSLADSDADATARTFLIGRDGGADVLIAGTAARLTGLSGNDTLTGGAGNDTLDGGSGADVMTGGLGADRFIVDDAGDRVIDGVAGGRDVVIASVSFALGAGVDDLRGTGRGAIDLAGNGLANTITGTAGANRISGQGGRDALSGLNGNDTLRGGAGDDTMAGGLGQDRLDGGGGNDVLAGDGGRDTFVFVGNFGRDAILGFAEGDRIDLRAVAAITSFADLAANHLTATGGNVVITAGAARITLTGAALDGLDAGDFLF